MVRLGSEQPWCASASVAPVAQKHVGRDEDSAAVVQRTVHIISID